MPFDPVCECMFLIQQFVRLFKVLKGVGKVTYWLALPTSMDHIYNMFHVLLLYKYISDLTHVLRIK